MNNDSILIEFDVTRTPAEPPLEFRVLLNRQPVYVLAADSEHVKIEINDQDPTEHEIEFELTGKQLHHTKLNEQNEITQDAVITVQNITIDGIPVDQLISEKSQYRHNYNGHRDSVTDQFYGVMGCNGSATFRFSTPIYMWLLENI